MIRNLVFSFVIFFSGACFAQMDSVFDRSKLVFGVKAGINISNVYDSQGQSFQADSKLGGVIGLYTLIPVGNFVGFQPEVHFSQKGFKATGVAFGNSYQFTRTTNYVDIPLLFALRPVSYVTIVAGPQYSFLLKQTDKFKSSEFSFSQEQEFKNDNLRKNTLCIVGGLDVNIKHMVISARAGWDLQNNNGNGTSDVPRYKNMWYQATIGFRMY